jgi:hypothetical protein
MVAADAAAETGGSGKRDAECLAEDHREELDARLEEWIAARLRAKRCRAQPSGDIDRETLHLIRRLHTSLRLPSIRTPKNDAREILGAEWSDSAAGLLCREDGV